MARNHKFFFDRDGSPKARGPGSEKLLMSFLETDVQGSDHICHDLMDDLTAIEEGSDASREFVGNAHSVTISADGIVIEVLQATSSGTNADGAAETPSDTAATVVAQAGAEQPVAGAAPGHRDVAGVDEHRYTTGLKHFREILEDWEAFILDDQIDDALLDDDLLA